MRPFRFACRSGPASAHSRRFLSPVARLARRGLVGLAFVLPALAACSDDLVTAGPPAGSGGGAAAFSGSGSACDDCPAPEPCAGEAEREGVATYYDFADGTGACSFAAPPENMRVAAANPGDFAGSAACGACVRVRGPEGEITVRIVDLCPGCEANHLDLSPEAFDAIAELGAGRVPIAWTWVPCEVEGPIVYHYQEGANPWWTTVQIRNHRHPIAKVEHRAPDGSYVAMLRESYNYFVAANGLGEGPYAFRVTDVHGHVLEDGAVPFTAGQDASGAGQFPACE